MKYFVTCSTKTFNKHIDFDINGAYFFISIRPTPIATRTATRFPSATLFRSRGGGGALGRPHRCHAGRRSRDLRHRRAAGPVRRHRLLRPRLWHRPEIGRAHIGTPVTNAHLVCRILLDKKQKNTNKKEQRISHDKENPTKKSETH